MSQVATLGIEIDASGHRESFVTHLIRENRGRERDGERERRRKGEREESIRERPSEIMYTPKMMATVHAMGSRKRRPRVVFLCRERRFGEIADIPGGRSDLDISVRAVRYSESGIRKALDHAIISMIPT